MSIQDLDVDDLIYRLGREYPTSTSTWNPCTTCARSARGLFCSDCISAELVRRGAKFKDVEILRDAFVERALFARQLETCGERIVRQIKKAK